MSEITSAWTPLRKSSARLENGDRVRIRRGTLAGVNGVISGFTAANHCILILDATAPGVRLVTGPDQLERIESPKKAAS